MYCVFFHGLVFLFWMLYEYQNFYTEYMVNCQKRSFDQTLLLKLQ